MNTFEFPNRGLITEQATAWIAVIDRGISSKEQSQLDEWLSQGSFHGEALVQAASMWDQLDVLNPISKLLPIEQLESMEKSDLDEENEPSINQDPAPGNVKSYLLPLSIAASLFVLAVGLLFFGNYAEINVNDSPSLLTKAAGPSTSLSESTPLQKPTAQIYATAVGEQSTIGLSDGSEIKLNTNSELAVHFTDNERRILLNQGEAYFDVAKNPDRPFVVITEDSMVTAVGTAFSIDVSHASDTEVLVAEGRVKVDRHSFRISLDQVTKPTTKSLNEEPVYLSQGQKALLNEDVVTLTTSDDVEEQLAWRDGRIIFTGETLAQVVEEINRYSSMEFAIADPSIESVSVGGFFKTGDMEQLIAVLEQNFGVRSERQTNKVVLSKIP